MGEYSLELIATHNYNQGFKPLSRVSNPGAKWQSRKSGIFFQISRNPRKKDSLKCIFIIHLALLNEPFIRH